MPNLTCAQIVSIICIGISVFLLGFVIGGCVIHSITKGK